MPSHDPERITMQTRLLSLIVLLLPASVSAQSFDARNFAMGGVGVASTRFVAAGFTNPALLARAPEGAGPAFIFPNFGILLNDEDGLVDSIDDFQKEVDRVQAAFNSPNPPTGQELLNLSRMLLNLNNKRAIANFGAGFAFAMPGEALSWSVFAHTYSDGQITALVDPVDITTIITATNPSDLDNLVSEGVVVGTAVTEVGVALATQLELAGARLSIGLTPKFQRIDTYNYSINVNTFDDGDFTGSQYRTDKSAINFDLGAAATVLDYVTVGLVARNLIRQEVDTVVTNGRQATMVLDPLVTLGAAVELGLVTLAAEIDLTQIERVERIVTGLPGPGEFETVEDNSQFARIGAEFHAGLVDLRLGYQGDLEETAEGLLTGGLGVNLPVVAIDLTVLGNPNGDTLGAAFQLSCQF